MGQKGVVDRLVLPVLVILTLVALVLFVTSVISKWVVVGVGLAMIAANLIGMRQRLRNKNRH
jgi:hypothetical protein